MLAPLSSARIAWVGNARWITSMIAASDSRSASVTRSIELDLRLMVIRLSRLRWIRPAARAARSATCSISFITVKESITRREKRPAPRVRSIDKSKRDANPHLPARRLRQAHAERDLAEQLAGARVG